VERSSIEGNGQGLDVRNGARVTVRDTVITRSRLVNVAVGSSEPEITQLTLEGCIISNGGVGLTSNNANSIVRVSNSSITDNDRGIDPPCCVGVQFLSRLNNTVEGNVVDGTFSGVYTVK
jgi:hypothetical protein